jgi:hypothetical protein
VDQRNGPDLWSGPLPCPAAPLAGRLRPCRHGRGINPASTGYDATMSESSDETGRHETPEVGLVPDEDLPEDLQPDKNPLAADPDATDGPGGTGDTDGSGGGDGSGTDTPQVEGMPDMGQPGA